MSLHHMTYLGLRQADGTTFIELLLFLLDSKNEISTLLPNEIRSGWGQIVMVSSSVFKQQINVFYENRRNTFVNSVIR